MTPAGEQFRLPGCYPDVKDPFGLYCGKDSVEWNWNVELQLQAAGKIKCGIQNCTLEFPDLRVKSFIAEIGNKLIMHNRDIRIKASKYFIHLEFRIKRMPFHLAWLSELNFKEFDEVRYRKNKMEEIIYQMLFYK